MNQQTINQQALHQISGEEKKDLLSLVTAHRRALHQIPELALSLPKTQQYIRKVLSVYPCRILTPIPSSIAAFFDNHKPDTIAFRADMDALPVTEESGVSFASRHPGCMHACGHDGHMAMLLGFAEVLSKYYQTLPHNVLLIFQPGEENPGGAELICQSGLLKECRVRHIFGFHLWPLLPAGTVATRKNELMARSSEVNIDIDGKSAHAAKYKDGIDALETGARFLLDAYALEQSLPENVFRLLRFGRMESGTIRNVVSSHTRLEGTLRAFQDEAYDCLSQGLLDIAGRYERETGAKFRIHYSTGYPAVLNDAALVEKAQAVLPELVLLQKPEMISEDFSQYQKQVPGVFFFLGTGTGIPLHAANFDFQEEILLRGIESDVALSFIPAAQK